MAYDNRLVSIAWISFIVHEVWTYRNFCFNASQPHKTQAAVIFRLRMLHTYCETIKLKQNLLDSFCVARNAQKYFIFSVDLWKNSSQMPEDLIKVSGLLPPQKNREQRIGRKEKNNNNNH